jgi:hypothetical protein
MIVLAQRAQSRLSSEANHPEPNLRVLLGHACLLESLQKAIDDKKEHDADACSTVNETDRDLEEKVDDVEDLQRLGVLTKPLGLKSLQVGLHTYTPTKWTGARGPPEPKVEESDINFSLGSACWKQPSAYDAKPRTIHLLPQPLIIIEGKTTSRICHGTKTGGLRNSVMWSSFYLHAEG